MPALNAVAIITAKPGSESIVGDALQALVTPTLGEEGCESYRLFVSAADPAVFVTIEEWRSQEDLDAHLGTPHVQAAFGAAGEHLAAPPAIHPLSPVG